MYGNNFDYTGQQPDVDREYLKQIMEDTRNEVSQYTAQGYPDEDMGARFEAAGVGNVSRHRFGVRAKTKRTIVDLALQQFVAGSHHA